MSKIKLSGVVRGEKRVQFTLEKTQEFVPMVRKLLKDFAKDDDSIFLDIPGPKDDYDVRDEPLEKYNDTCIYRKYKKLDVEIFIGNEKIVVAIRSDLEIQQKIVDFIMKYCKWVK